MTKKTWNDMEDYKNFPQEVQDILVECEDDTQLFAKEMHKLGYEVDLDMDGSIVSFSKELLTDDSNLHFIKLLPFQSQIDDTISPIALWSCNSNACEFIEERNCDTSGIYYGTEEKIEPKFCARHFYQHVVSGDGKSNYTLIA